MMEAFAICLDVFAVVFAAWVARRLRSKPSPVENWRPSDDARSGRRITLMMYPKGTRR